MKSLQQDPTSQLWTKAFISLTLCSFLLFLNLQMLLSSFPTYVKGDLGAGDLEVSLVTSLFALSAIATRFATAALMRRFSRNALLHTGLIVAGITTASYMLTDTIGSLLVMRILYGIGFGMASTIIPTLVSRIMPPSRMGEGIGYFGLSTSLAMSIGPLIGMNVMKQAGFTTLTAVGAVVVLLAVPILLLSRAVPREMAKGGSAGRNAPRNAAAAADSSHAAHVKPAFNRKLIFPALLNMLLSITYSGLLSFIALFGETVHLEQVGLFFLFNVITILIIRPISGRIFDSRGHAAVLIPAAISVVLSMVVLSYATTMPMLIVSALLYGLGFGAIQPTLQAWMLRSSTPEQHGMANSMYYNSTDLGVAIGAFVLGAISSHTGYAVMYRYSAGVMVLFLLLYVLVRMVHSAKCHAASKANVSA